MPLPAGSAPPACSCMYDNPRCCCRIAYDTAPMQQCLEERVHLDASTISDARLCMAGEGHNACRC